MLVFDSDRVYGFGREPGLFVWSHVLENHLFSSAREADESTIQEAMRNGACDLVSIGLRKRLQSVVTRELRALRAERALNSTIASATEYKRQIRDYMNNSTSAIALAQEGIVIEANDGKRRIPTLAFEDQVVVVDARIGL